MDLFQDIFARLVITSFEYLTRQQKPNRTVSPLAGWLPIDIISYDSFIMPVDTWIDRALDYLREHRLHPIVEVVVAWKVAITCLVYYGVSFATGRLLFLGTSNTVVPLTTMARRRRNESSSSWCLDDLCRLASDELVGRIRNDLELRRHVSSFLVSEEEDRSNDNAVSLRHQLKSVWRDLLKFPAVETDTERYLFDISLVIPAYREPVDRIVWTLEQALMNCSDDPSKIQVILVVVDAHAYAQVPKHAWGQFLLVTYDGDGGRGPCQNFGASLARGKLLTFLHADTVLPAHWDRKVRDILLPRPGQARTIQACAFAFGHNTSFLDGMPYPWGIRSVWLLGNLRAYFFSLPYGDHIISMPTAYFRYIGGFPDQPIMEDYELMDILRRRAKILPECICIIPPPTGRCSVRRWQRFGVVYVTLVNALLVQRYAHGGWTADDVYDYYYKRPFANAKR